MAPWTATIEEGPVRSPRRVERHDDELGRWRLFTRPVRGPLAGLASEIRGYEQDATTPGSHVTAATARLPLVIPFGHRHVVTAEGGAPQEVGAFLAGSHDRVGTVTSTGFTGMQVDLSPVAAHRIVGGGVADLAGTVVDLDDLLGAVGRRLVDQLADLDDWSARLDLLEGVLAERFLRGPTVDVEVAEVWRRLETGTTRIDAVVAGLGWSPRQVRRRVRAQLGLPPKRLARLMRFERALDRLEWDRETTLARVATDLGYYDEAHMANDFRDLAGRSPGTERARRAPA